MMIPQQQSSNLWPESAFMFEAILKAAIVVVTDVARNVVQCNNRFCEVSGYEREEILGRNLRTLMSEVHDERFFLNMRRRIACGKVWRGSICGVRKDQSLYWLGTTIVPQLAADGSPVGYVSIGFDVEASGERITKTSSAYSDGSMRAHALSASGAQKVADQVGGAHSELLTNISHQLRTPMNGIVGMTALLLESGLTPRQKEFADIVRASANTLNEVMENVIDAGRLNSGTASSEESEVRLTELVKGIVDRFEPCAADRGLEIATHIDQGARAVLIGDERRLRRVIENLLSDAVRFSERGEVSICIKSRSRAAGGKKLRIEIHDTSAGRGAESRLATFQARSGADESAIDQLDGNGLGKFVTRRFVELMGGKIGAVTRSGGSTVWFELEMRAPAADLKPVPPPLLENERIRVLVVMDDEPNRARLLRQLEALGAAAVRAQTAAGNSTLDAAQASGRPFDVLILDASTSDGSGIEFATRVRADDGLRQPAIILLQSSNGLPPGDRQLETLVDAVLPKPVRQHALVHCMATLMADAHSPKECGNGKVEKSPAAVDRGHILLVDDNDVNRLLAKLILEREGYRVTCVPDGAAAVSAVSGIVYDLILMDLQMPIMDGFQATRLIRELGGETGTVPIVALTASNLIVDQQGCVQAGMDDYLCKPLAATELLQLVARRIRSTASGPQCAGSVARAAPNELQGGIAVP